MSLHTWRREIWGFFGNVLKKSRFTVFLFKVPKELKPIPPNSTGGTNAGRRGLWCCLRHLASILELRPRCWQPLEPDWGTYFWGPTTTFFLGRQLFTNIFQESWGNGANPMQNGYSPGEACSSPPVFMSIQHRCQCKKEHVIMSSHSR